jgi:predicted Zn-dependent protease
MRRTVALSLFAALAVAQQREPGKGINFYTIEKEIALGRQLAVEFQRTSKPLNNDVALAYVTGLGQRLAAQLGGPSFAYTFALIADDPTVLHEVAAFPGGFLFVPASLILAAKDEDELAGMLAHSIAHVASRHGSQAATRAELSNTMAQPLIFMGGRAGHAIPQGAGLAIPMGFLQFRRKMELDADRQAAAAMAATGHDPAALARYLEREQASYDENSSQTVSPFPRRSQRVEAIRAVVADLPAREYERREGLRKIQEELRRAVPPPVR